MRLVGWRVPMSLLLLIASGALPGCGGPLEDPMGTLSRPDSLPSMQSRALDQLADDGSAEYARLLRRIIVQPGYTPDIREKAFRQLATKDPEGLRDTLALSLPKMQMLEWRTRVCQLIAEERLVQMTPVLINALAAPMGGWIREDQNRPEFKALVALHGEGRVPDVLYQAMLESNPVTQANLRERCWALLWRLGDQQRLVALVQDDRIKPGDAFLQDLRAAAGDLGVLPRTREEIRWLRALREPSRAGFWRDAMTAIGAMDRTVRSELELRELPVAVAAAKFRPDLLGMTPQAMYPMLESRIRSEGRRTYSPSFEGYSGNFTESLYQQRDQLKWGDYAAMLLACDMMEQEETAAQLFDIADRDLHDRSTEYGGVIELDDRGRFVVREFRPRVQGSDLRFEAPQEMFDLAYTSLFHFHNHAQSYDNRRYAGPHLGDFEYADSTRANCLVFTFIDRSTLNVDFYRFGRVVVDLGTMRRPTGRSAGRRRRAWRRSSC